MYFLPFPSLNKRTTSLIIIASLIVHFIFLIILLRISSYRNGVLSSFFHIEHNENLTNNSDTTDIDLIKTTAMPDPLTEWAYLEAGCDDSTESDNVPSKGINSFTTMPLIVSPLPEPDPEPTLSESTPPPEQDQTVSNTPSILQVKNENISTNAGTIALELNKTIPSLKPIKKKTTHALPSSSITLAQLAQNFIQQGNNHNSSRKKGACATMNGTHGGVANTQQIIFSRYAEKIHAALQQSFRILHNHTILSLASRAGPSLNASAQLDKSGTLMIVKITQSSRIPELDGFVLKVFEHARCALPTIPDTLPVLIINIEFIDIISFLQAPFSAARLSKQLYHD